MIVALVANRFVEVAFVLVVFVKTPVDGVVAPIVVPLIVPPPIVTCVAINEAMVPVAAVRLVPEAEKKLKAPDDVALAKTNPVAEAFVNSAFDEVRLVANKFVEVVFVPVALVQSKFAKFEVEVPVMVKF